MLNSSSLFPSLECGIWLAPSAIEGAGLGMYAGRNFKKGELMQDVGDCCIPIVDIKKHNEAEDRNYGNNLWEHYTWSAPPLDVDQEGLYETNVASPGFGSVANSFLPLVNIDELEPRRDYAGLHRSKDPGSGAFTPYYDRGSKANRDIAAGEELYVSYGEEWFTGREFMGPIPLKRDLQWADELFRKYSVLKQLLNNIPASVLEEMWEVFVKQNEWADYSRILGGFNRNDNEELNLLEKYQSIRDLRIRQALRSQEWLQKYGTCADHIRGGHSTIEQAGHGAFATRELPEGTIVAHVPLIHILHRGRFNMYYFDPNDKENPSMSAGMRPPQIMLNYCYGHQESTLLLCPYGPIVNLVNHNQTRANIKIQWADPARGNFIKDLLNISLENLQQVDSAKFAFEFVAIRHIMEGEEVFLDYGDAWEIAWQRHLENWQPVRAASAYKNADELNKMLQEGLLDLPTEFESKEENVNKFPNVKLACNNYFSDDLWRSDFYAGRMEKGLREYKENSVEYLYCYLLRRAMNTTSGKFMYTVEARNDNDESFLWEDVPYEVFHFLDMPYGTDMFLPNAFRHDIRIPDHMFPTLWRNHRGE